MGARELDPELELELVFPASSERSSVLADVAPLVPDAYASPSAPASSLSVSASAAGAFAALSVAAGLWFASKAIPRRAYITHTLPVRAAAVASGSAMSK